MAMALALALPACGVERSKDPKAGQPGGPTASALFVAVGSNGGIITSLDGTTWTPRSSGTGAPLTAVSFGPSGFVAVGGAGTVVRSPDGVTWARAAAPTTTDLARVTFTGERFVAVGGGWTEGATTLTSVDGASWVAVTSPASHLFHGVVQAGGTLIAAAYYRSDIETPTQFHSISGGGWTMNEGPDFYDGISVDGHTVVVGGAVSFSADEGASWETTIPGWKGFEGVAFGAGTFVVVGEGGLLYTSSDGRLWVARENPLGQAGSFSSVCHGAGRFVAVGSPGQVLTSADGVTWTAGASGVTESLAGITYGRAR